ncbi:membrane protein [Salmonella enterica subsp. enterica]|uniref:Membrane protein n=1 Tax=Salmonella enterica I TaxID=59201 RepID=A0A379VID6_SALET|nr:membrane protein [Salmonella enterica subsp. enterica]
MLLTGLLQGVLCYLLMAWLVPQNSDWLFYGMPATIALSSMLLLTVVSFKQRALWGLAGADLCGRAGNERLAEMAG